MTAFEAVDTGSIPVVGAKFEGFQPMVVLKDGSLTEDPRLDRLKEFDQRSRNFAAVDTLDTRKPRSYTWRVTKWLDQGFEGACVGFAYGHDAAARPVQLTFVDDSYARNKIYFRAQEIDPWPGGAYPGATPFYEGTSVLSGAKAAQELGHFERYEWAFGLDETILAVGYKGPAVIGVDWFEGMYRPDADGFLRPTGRVVGGHAILLNSVNVKKGIFKVHNSWGRDWGNEGSAMISFDDMETLLARQGEVCIPVLRKWIRVAP